MSLAHVLRAHDHAVTIVDFYYVRSKFCDVLEKTLVSGDEQGNLVWWDLRLRRPICRVKAHDNNILSVAQLGISWRCRNSEDSGSMMIASFGFMYGTLITHSRDNSVKFWRLSREKGTIEQLSDMTQQVNSLNFCNVAVYEDRVAFLNRLNGDFFDVCQITENGFEPQYESIDVKQLVSKYKNTMTAQEAAKTAKLGILMKLLWLSRDVLCLGFESGHVIAINVPIIGKSLLYFDDTRLRQLEMELDQENLKEVYLEASNGNLDSISHLVYGDTTTQSGISMIYFSSFHYPNPVLDLALDLKHNLLVSTSAGSKIAVHDTVFSQVFEQPLVLEYDTRCIGLNSVSWRSDDLLSVSLWNGLTKFYKLQVSASQSAALIKLDLNVSRAKSHVQKEFSSNPNDPEILQNSKSIKRVKGNVVRMCMKQFVDDKNNANFKAKSTKEFLEYKNFMKSLNDDLVVIGYDDGSVELHHVSITR